MIALREGALIAAGATVVATGIWLTISGRPYATPLQTTHKIVDLLAIVAIGFFVYRVWAEAGSVVNMPVLLLAVAVALIAFATGGMVSAMEAVTAPAVWIHRIAGFALPVLAGYLMFLVRPLL